MKRINAVTFGYMAKEGELGSPEAAQSLELLVSRTSASTIILPVVALQANAHTIDIDWKHNLPTDNEVIDTVEAAGKLGLDVILKPMVNLEDGTWRAYINFLWPDVPCEPKWSEWFANYEKFILHYAEIAEKTGCRMLVIGCEMVSTDGREKEWRSLIEKVREIYHGLITYNCDKYQEDRLSWWDAVDVISSSGYYPYDKWEENLQRIEKVVKMQNKPFFFCEAGAPSRDGGELLPNDWTLPGEVNMDAQTRFFEAMFVACARFDFVEGFGLWDWKAILYREEDAANDRDYALFNKPAEKIVKKYYKMQI
ncbi:hypothetical protein OfM1_00570 [Lactovum odontotermitis]